MKKLTVGTMFSRHDLSDLDFGMGKRKTDRHPMKDSDKDGVNDFADCQPHNPNKQGPLAYAAGKYLRKKKGFIGKAARSYAEYRKEAPDREKARIESLKRRAQIEEQKARIAKARRVRVRPVGSMDYGKFFGLGEGVTPRAKPKATVKRKRRKVSRKSKGTKYIIRGGKAYPTV